MLRFKCYLMRLFCRHKWKYIFVAKTKYAYRRDCIKCGMVQKRRVGGLDYSGQWVDTIDMGAICGVCGKKYGKHSYVTHNCPQDKPFSWLPTDPIPPTPTNEESPVVPKEQIDKEMVEFAMYAWCEWEKVRNDPFPSPSPQQLLEKFRQKQKTN